MHRGCSASRERCSPPAASSSCSRSPRRRSRRLSAMRARGSSSRISRTRRRCASSSRCQARRCVGGRSRPRGARRRRARGDRAQRSPGHRGGRPDRSADQQGHRPRPGQRDDRQHPASPSRQAVRRLRDRPLGEEGCRPPTHAELDYLIGMGAQSALAARVDCASSKSGAGTRPISGGRSPAQGRAELDALGRLAGGVAHDFNKMLSVLLRYASLMSSSLPADGPLRSDVGEIIKAAERSAELTRRLHAFGRGSAAEARILDLNDTIASVAKMLGRLIDEFFRHRLPCEAPRQQSCWAGRSAAARRAREHPLPEWICGACGVERQRSLGVGLAPSRFDRSSPHGHRHAPREPSASRAAGRRGATYPGRVHVRLQRGSRRASRTLGIRSGHAREAHHARRAAPQDPRGAQPESGRSRGKGRVTRGIIFFVGSGRVSTLSEIPGLSSRSRGFQEGDAMGPVSVRFRPNAKPP
jgi:hypothetical protein